MPTPYEYQEIGAEFLVRKHRAILSDDMGTGKSIQSILAAQSIGAKKVLIICPNTVKYVWESELNKWIDIPEITVVKGNAKQREELILNSGRFTIINYENINFRATKTEKGIEENKKDKIRVKARNMKMLEKQGLIEVDRRHTSLMKSMDWDLIICDEAHKLRNRNNRIYMALDELCRALKCPVYFLTGTPMMNAPQELWGILHLIDPQKYGSYWSFVEKYCDKQINSFRGRRVVTITGAKNTDKLRDELSQYMLRRMKEDVLDLPEKTYQNLSVEMDGYQLSQYRQMFKKLYVETSSGIIEAPIALTKTIRLKQIAVAPELLDENEKELSGNKIELLFDIIDGSGDDKVVIFTQFAGAAKRLMKMLTDKKYNWVGFTGDDNYDKREIAIKEFQNNPKVKCFVSTIQASGVGITLTAGKIAVFLDLMWNPALNKQAADRLHRNGVKHPVTIYTLTAKNSIEEHINDVLDNKQALFDELIPVAKIRKIALDYISNNKYNENELESLEVDNNEL